MPIPVICPGCKARFTVSDQFAGRTGPCPKCKQSITIPSAVVKAVTIHEPEPPTTASGTPGRMPTAPIRRVEKQIPGIAFAAIGAGAIAMVVAAWGAGALVGAANLSPALLLAAAWLIALPCAALGYVAVRDRELEPHRGRAFLVRSLICATVYAGLWAAKGLLPAEATAEMWQWLYLGPIFVGAGALAALATFDLDPSSAVAHFSLYAMFTAMLRWLMGLPPL